MHQFCGQRWGEGVKKSRNPVDVIYIEAPLEGKERRVRRKTPKICPERNLVEEGGSLPTSAPTDLMLNGT